MAHIWISKHNETDQWVAISLGHGGRVFLTGDASQPVAAGAAGSSDGAGAYIIHHSQGNVANDNGQWILYASCGANVHVNGRRLALGMRGLEDKDEICVGQSGSMFFSLEKLAAIEKFPGIGRSAPCPRCRRQLAIGDQAVRCPQCAVWHHQTDELDCWTYSEKCAACGDHPTALAAAGYRWTPEDL